MIGVAAEVALALELLSFLIRGVMGLAGAVGTFDVLR